LPPPPSSLPFIANTYLILFSPSQRIHRTKATFSFLSLGPIHRITSTGPGHIFFSVIGTNPQDTFHRTRPYFLSVIRTNPKDPFHRSCSCHRTLKPYQRGFQLETALASSSEAFKEFHHHLGIHHSNFDSEYLVQVRNQSVACRLLICDQEYRVRTINATDCPSTKYVEELWVRLPGANYPSSVDELNYNLAHRKFLVNLTCGHIQGIRLQLRIPQRVHQVC
jgi:hypothetical protein